MLDWSLIAIGFGVGIAMAAPMGPVNIMVIHRGVRHGFMAAFIAGMGALVGDGLYAAVAAFGITAISETIEGHMGLIQLVGGFVLIGFGLMLVLSKPHPERRVEEDTRLSMFGAAFSSFVLCVTNPALLLAFVAVFAGLDDLGRAPDNYISAIELTAGVLAGGAVWWFFVASIVGRYRSRINLRWLRLINIIAGVALIAFGVLLLTNLAIDRL